MDNRSTQSTSQNARLRWAETAPGAFKLSGSLEIETAATLREILLDFLSHGPPKSSELSGADTVERGVVTIDLSDIEVCGTSGVQLLLSASRTAAVRGCHLRLSSPSPAIEKAFATFGIATESATGAAIQ